MSRSAPRKRWVAVLISVATVSAAPWWVPYVAQLAALTYQRHHDASAVVEERVFTMQAGQTLVTLSGDAAVESVHLDGVDLVRDVDYSFSGNTLTLKYPALGGQMLKVNARKAQ